MEYIRGDDNMLRKILDSKYFQIPFKIVKFIIFLILIVYLAFIVVQRISGNQSIFGYRIFAVATGSMIPDYNINDVLAIQEVNSNDLKIGDDITYLGKKLDVNGRIVTHRIIDIKTENGVKKFITKGVNSAAEDPAITDDQIYGKVLGKIPIKVLHVLTVIIMVFMAFDFIISSFALKMFETRLIYNYNLEVQGAEDYYEKYLDIYQNNPGLKEFVDKVFSDEKMLKTFPNIKFTLQDGSILLVKDILTDIKPYYIKVFDV